MSDAKEEKKDEIREAPIQPNLWVDGPDGIPDLVATKCTACGDVFFPRTKVCYSCISDANLEEIRLRGKGNLYTFTAVKRGLPGFPSPYYLGSIDLENGPRAIFQMRECGLEDLKTGMEMEAYIDLIRTEEDGTRMVGPVFRPVKK